MKKQIITMIFSYIGKYKYYLFASMILALISVAGTLYVPVIIGGVIDCLVGKGLVDFQLIIQDLLTVCIIILIVAMSQWLMNVCNNKITFNVVRDMRDKAFAKIET